MTCDEARDQAAGFVLGALTPDEERAVREHLATCQEAHEEFAELGSVVPALTASVEQVEPPPALRERIMAAAAADLRERAPATVPSVAPAVLPRPVAASNVEQFRPIAARSRAPRFGWVLGLAAVLAIAALGVWNVRLQTQLTDAQAYQQRVEEVLTIARTPGAVMAVLAPATAGGQDGLIAIASNGDAAMVVKGLPAAAANEVYEVWVIVGANAPIPAGALSQSAAARVHERQAWPGAGRRGRGLDPRARPEPDGPDFTDPREGRRRPLGLTPGVSRLRSPRSPSSRRPPIRARSSATPAAASRSSDVVPSVGKRAIPAETVIGRPPTGARAAIPSRTRRATRAPAAPGAMTTNSSPPWRATVSTRRTDSASTDATERRTSSPAWWPCCSLSAANPSRSKIATDTSLPCRPARASSSSRTRSNVRWFARPVRGSVWAIRSNHSDRSATIEARRLRSTATAHRPAMASRRAVSRRSRCAARPRRAASTPSGSSTPPRAMSMGRIETAATPAAATKAPLVVTRVTRSRATAPTASPSASSASSTAERWDGSSPIVTASWSPERSGSWR